MTRISSSLDNRLTLRNFSLYETKIPKASFKQKIEKALSSSMSQLKKSRSGVWRSRSVLPNKVHQSFVRNNSLKSSSITIFPKQRIKPLLHRSTSVQVKSQSPTKLKFHQIQIQQQDLQFKRKEKNVDKQVKNWKNRNNFLKTMIPLPEYIPPPPPPKIQKPPIEKQRINLLIENLRINIQYFWNVFQNVPKMSNLLKSLEGYNLLVHSVLFKNNEVARISSQTHIQKFFEVYKQENYRIEDYVDKDTRLYTALLFFNLKMQQKADTLQRQFMMKGEKGLDDNIKMLEEQNSRVSKITKQQNKYETLQFLADQRTFITNFKKGDTIKRLEELGVKVSINEKIKDKVLSSKQMLSSSFVQPLMKSVSPYIIHTSKF